MYDTYMTYIHTYSNPISIWALFLCTRVDYIQYIYVHIYIQIRAPSTIDTWWCLERQADSLNNLCNLSVNILCQYFSHINIGEKIIFIIGFKNNLILVVSKITDIPWTTVFKKKFGVPSTTIGRRYWYRQQDEESERLTYIWGAWYLFDIQLQCVRTCNIESISWVDSIVNMG